MKQSQASRGNADDRMSNMPGGMGGMMSGGGMPGGNGGGGGMPGGGMR